MIETFNVRLLDDAVEIEGYVNAVERPSKILEDRSGEFTETIKVGAFEKALERNNNVRILLNHQIDRDLGGQLDGNLELHEDAIGLHVNTTIRDAEVVEKARNDELVGWSFGFYDVDVRRRVDENGMVSRSVYDLELEEVSILDNTRIPAYAGTLVNVRDTDGKRLKYGAMLTREAMPKPEEEPPENPISEPSEPSEEPEVVQEIDYSEFDEMIRTMKGGEGNNV